MLPTNVQSEGGISDLQVFISEHMLQSAVSAGHKAGFLQFSVPDVPSQVIDTIFDNFINVYGTFSKGVKVVVSSMSLNQSAEPLLKIVDGGTIKVSLPAYISVKNPLATSYDAITMKAFLEFDFQPSLDLNAQDSLVIRATLSNFSLIKLESIRTLYK